MSRKHYEENFKKQIVNIYNQGNHTYRSLSEEYGVAMSTMRQWVIRYDNSKSFNEESILTKHIKKIFKRSRKIDEILDTFNIERSLSRKGNPYDNAVSEATNKILKIEFIYQNNFDTLEELELQLAEYIY